MEFRVEEQNGEIIVTDGVFTAVYFKPVKLDPTGFGKLIVSRSEFSVAHPMLSL